MKKEYTKPNMKIVSYAVENIITTSAITKDSSFQSSTSMTTISY